MMFAALMFVLGVWCVQQFTQLPNVFWLASLFVLAVVTTISLVYMRDSKQSYSALASSFSSSSTSIWRFSKYFHLFGVGIVALILGLVWASSVALLRMSDALPKAWEQKTILLVGVVASVPEVTERGERFKFNVESVLTPDAVVPQHISLNHYRVDVRAEAQPATRLNAKVAHHHGLLNASQFHAGERWKISVKLKRPHGTLNPHGFDFEAWALSENMRATGTIKAKAGMKKLDDLVWHPMYLMARLRENIKYRITDVLENNRYVGVIQALVMGDDSQISVDDWQVFLQTGTTHLMSISGLHITMLSGLVFGLVYAGWRRVPLLVLKLPARKAAALSGVIVACAYAFVAGFSVPTQRTFYMLMVFFIALWSGRQWAMAQVLVIALFVVVLLDPWAVASPGFWLSFGAVAIISYALGGRVGKLHWLKVALQTQWAVTIGMLPLLLIMFNQASIISPIANALAIPVISFVVTPLALLGSFLPIDALLQLANVVLVWLMHALNGLNQLPVVSWHQHAPPVRTLAPALFGVMLLLLPRGVPLRWLGLAGLLPMLFVMPSKPMMGEMNVMVLDVGQGLSVVVQTARHTLLYDAGPMFSAQSDAGSRIVLPYLYGEGIKALDGMIVSHDDNDHSGGMMSVLKQMPVAWLLSSFQVDLLQNKTLNNVKSMACVAGQSWLWDQVRFEVLYPTHLQMADAQVKDNNRSCVLKVTSLAGSILLTGDIEKEAERTLLEGAFAEKLKSDVMVVPHHGSKTSSTIDFLNAVLPQKSILTNGYLNRFGHPKPAVVERYQDMQSQLYRSDADGAVIVNFKNVNLQNNNVSSSEISVYPWRAHYKRYWLDAYRE
jgi:competence protein ComEC